MHFSKTTRIFISVCLVLLSAGLCLGAFSMAKDNEGISPTVAAVPYESKYVDRIHLQLDATQFVFMREDSGLYTFTFTFTAEKEQADFYAVLDGMELVGIPYTEMRMKAAPANGDTVALPGAKLPAVSEEKTAPLQWTAEVTFRADTPVTYRPTLRIAYTSGTKTELADSHLTEIELLVKVCDLDPLPQAMEDARAYFTLGIYTEESLAELRDKLDEIEIALRQPENLTDTQISVWLQEIAYCISALQPI